MNIQPGPIRYDLPLDSVLSVVSKAITTGKIFLAQTPGTLYILACLIDLLERGKRGMVIGAETTFGKSQCLRYILNALSDAIGDLVPHLVIEKLPAGGSPYGSLLLSIGQELGLSMTSRTSIYHRTEAIVLAFYQWALRSGYRTVILALDEAQSIDVDQLRHIKGIGNKLRLLNCDLFLILAGQESLFQLEEKLDKCASEDADQLAERFLYNYRLPGLKSQAELKEFLALFDLAQYPRGYSLVGRYLPRAVAGGFKVTEWGEPIWSEIKLATPESVRQQAEIGIGHTVEMLAGLLTASARSDATNFKLPDDPKAFKTALGATRYAKSVFKRLKPKKGGGADGRI